MDCRKASVAGDSGWADRSSDDNGDSSDPEKESARLPVRIVGNRGTTLALVAGNAGPGLRSQSLLVMLAAHVT